jgi:hypothetical protein
MKVFWNALCADVRNQALHYTTLIETLSNQENVRVKLLSYLDETLPEGERRSSKSQRIIESGVESGVRPNQSQTGAGV